MTKPQSNDEISPDELMEAFRGRSLKSIILFTVAVHAVVLVGTSVPAILKVVAGKDTAALSEGERLDEAVREATESLRAIAAEHGIKPQDLSSQFAGGPRAARASSTETPAASGTTPTEPEGEATSAPDDPKSAIEEAIDVKANGPALPKMQDEEEDLFK